MIALVAPAGYGKSTLLCEWAACDPRPFAYLELTRDHDDPALLSSLLARTLAPMNAAGEQAVLVLDRVDRLRSPESLAIVAELAHELPPSLTLALASRSDPSLQLGRLHASERLLRLAALDLAMTAEEAERLFGEIERAGLEPRELERLMARTEGWPAGLHLAALALKERAAHGLDGEVTGEEQTIAEYVSEEVLAPLDAEARAFLRRASILEELSGEACDVTLARQRSGRMLAELAAAGTMLAAVDTAHTRFRCHPLVRDVLRGELVLCEPAEVPLLHRRASEWLAEQGDAEQALEHALAARATALAGELVWAQAAHLLYRRDEQLKLWLGTLTEREIASSPRLALAAAHASSALADLACAKHWARLADKALAGIELDEPARSSLRAAAQLAHVSAGCTIEQMASDAERARGALDESDPMHPLASMLSGVAAHLLGEPARARVLLEQALESCSPHTLPLVASISHAQLALIDVEEGRLEQAEDRAADAVSFTRELAPRRLSAPAHAALAFVKSRHGLADEAKTELARASRLFALPGELMPLLEVQTRIVMARVSIRLADAAHARALLSQASRLARRHAPIVPLLSWIDRAWSEIDELGIASMNGPGSLTMAELRVLRFLPTHLSFREIGERLHVSGNTVKSQAHAIYAKLDAASRTEAVARASALGLIDAAVV